MGSIPDRQALAEIVSAPDAGGSGAVEDPFFPPSADIPDSSGEGGGFDANPVQIDVLIPAAVNTMYVMQIMMLMAIGETGTPLTGGVSAALYLVTCYRDSLGALVAPAVSSLLSSESGEPSILSVTPQLIMPGPNTLRVRMESVNLGHNEVFYRYTLHAQPLSFEIPTPGS